MQLTVGTAVLISEVQLLHICYFNSIIASFIFWLQVHSKTDNESSKRKNFISLNYIMKQAPLTDVHADESPNEKSNLVPGF